MTREEAIELLKEYAPRIKPFYEPYRTEYPQALDMAIEALSEPSGDLISRADAIEHFHEIADDENTDFAFKMCIIGVVNDLKALPSADAENRLYIKIYADDEPSVKAEKLYQICGETQNREVTEWLKEYFPSADAVHGEWVEKEVMVDEDTNITEWQSARCSVCGKYHTTPYMYYFDNFSFCPNCGAIMKGGEE